MYGKKNRLCPWVCCNARLRNKVYRAQEKREWKKELWLCWLLYQRLARWFSCKHDSMPAMKDIEGYEGQYAITEDGRVWSLKRKIFRKPSLNPDTGYLQLPLCKNGIYQTVKIHRLVALTYLGEPPIDKPLALHKDGNKLNCDVSNLYWGDKSENGYDCVEHGNSWQKNKTHCPLGHILQEPNLVLGRIKKGFRSCRSCAAGHSYAVKHPEHSYEYWANYRYYPIYKPSTRC